MLAWSFGATGELEEASGWLEVYEGGRSVYTEVERASDINGAVFSECSLSSV